MSFDLFSQEPSRAQDKRTKVQTTRDVDDDCIVVGGGPAGCALVRGLLVRGLRVVLIEGGPREAYKHRLFHSFKNFAQASMTQDASYVYETEVQKHMNNRVLPAFRGKGIGGSANTNAGIWARGRKEDYSRWPWDAETIEKAFVCVEELVQPETIPCKGNGQLQIDVMREAGYKLLSGTGYIEDGVEMTLSAGHNRHRTRASAVFLDSLTPEQLSRLHVMDNTQARRVIIANGRATGVEVEKHGKIAQIRLANPKAEVVLCAGSFDSPKILMLSGLGPKAHLEEMGIQVHVDIPAVGQNMQDHLMLPVVLQSKRRIVTSDCNQIFQYGVVHTRTSTGKGMQMVMVNTCVTNVAPFFGPYSLIPGNSWLARGARTVLRTFLQFLMMLPWVRYAARQMHVMMLCIMQPYSKGSVTLRSSDPRDAPKVDPNFFSDARDFDTASAALAKFREVKSSSKLHSTIYGKEYSPNIDLSYANAHDKVKKWAKDGAGPYMHPVSTCRMRSPQGGDYVVDEELRVTGVPNLRVADASVAPCIPCGPTQAMAYMIGHVSASFVCPRGT